MRRPAPIPLPTVLVMALLVGVLPVLAQDPNECDVPGEVPDVIVGDVFDTAAWGTKGGISAFSIGTYSCNVGTCWLQWISNTSQHPVIGQNMFRLKDGRFEQIGQSWLKHGFLALSDELCNTGCVSTDGTHLGVNCADPYWAGLNGNQNGLGPKFEVDPASGLFPYPATDIGATGDAIYKRLQVNNLDLDPGLNAGARYFVEGQYITPDDAAAGTADNNASWREATVSFQGGMYTIDVIDETMRGSPAIEAWAQVDPTVITTNLRIPGDGNLIMASRSESLGRGWWHYEYAVQNINSRRGVGAIRVPIPGDAELAGIDFHDVRYHSGEPFASDDWPGQVVEDADGLWLEWRVPPGDPATANALRWGTLYNVRFDATRPPAAAAGDVVLELFQPGSPTTLTAGHVVPQICDGDGICEAGESCANCPADCLGPSAGFCGDGICETFIGEDCVVCPDDCIGVQSGSPSGRFCCGAGGGENPVGCEDARCTDAVSTCTDLSTGPCCGDQVCDAGETPCGCEADCGPCVESCVLPEDCDDGEFCNGAETCSGDTCVDGTPPCGSGLCDELLDECVECLTDSHCDDDVHCNGRETCVAETCQPGSDPCPGEVCNEDAEACVECASSADCDDGFFCNGLEVCSGQSECVAGTATCLPPDTCDEETDVCIICTADCDDGLFCNGVEECFGDTCFGGEPPCPNQPCDEAFDSCLGAPLQARRGDPLPGLSDDDLALFEAGRVSFERAHGAGDGLGPAYNGDSCASCHATGVGDLEITLFGRDDGGGGFDPMTSEGGPLLQSLAVSAECAETLPPTADVIVPRLVSTHMGAGLIEVIDDADLLAREIAPPAGISGRSVGVEPLESPGQSRVGRFGAKLERATLPSLVAGEMRDHLGVTNSLVPQDAAPNGDPALLATCDGMPDPEDAADGIDDAAAIVDYLRLLAPPPQTPRSGMTGETLFSIVGCGGCHVASHTTPDSPALPSALRGTTVKPYSDFLLHDLGDAADGIETAGAEGTEMRTAPLWDLRNRPRWWHDGRITGGAFADRVLTAVQWHQQPGSEAATAAATLLSLPQASFDRVVEFLDSLGRLEFDEDGDGDLDEIDMAGLAGCYGATSVTANLPCAIHDHDRDSDVDFVDYQLFAFATDVPVGGRVPDGASVPGAPLTVERAAGGAVTLRWSPSCTPTDDDYEVYEGPVGDFDAWRPVVCSTGGVAEATFVPEAGDRYFLVAPHNGIAGGSLGTESGGTERPATAFVCRPRLVQGCP